MKQFQVKDKVVALTTPENELSQHRVRGKVYEVTDTFICPNKSIQLININDTKQKSETSYIGCVCGEVHENRGLAWTHSDHFTSVNDVKDALAQAISNEDYDMAIALRDLKEV